MQIYSPNMLKTFEQCPHKFKLKYQDGISLIQNSKYFEKGKKIHALASYYLQGANIEKMEKSLNEQERQIWENLKNNKYFKMETIATEYNLSCRIGDFWVGGRLDALVCNHEDTLTLPSPLKGEGVKYQKFYNQQTLEKAKELRKNETQTEKIMWYLLRDRRFCGLKFRRQAPVGEYIADFLCAERKLIIEIDGSEHFEESRKKHDEKRTEFLEKEGFTVLRFTNAEVFNKITEVLEKIYLTLSLGRGQGEGMSYYILDYKTGQIPKNAENDFQTITYLLAVDKFLNKQDGYDSLKFVYLGLKEDEEKIIELTEENRSQFEEKIIKTCKNIELKVFPKNKRICEHCEYKKLCV